MQAQISTAIDDGSFRSTMTSAGLGDVTDVASTVINLYPSDSNNNNNNNNDPFSNTNNNSGEDSSKKTKMIIGIVIGATCLVCLAIVGTVCYMRKKAKIGQASSQ